MRRPRPLGPVHGLPLGTKDTVEAIKAFGAKVIVFAPTLALAKKLLRSGADAMVIITEWDSFRALDFDRIKAAMKSNIVIDLRNIYSPEDMAKHGFAYTSIGRPVV